MTSDVDWTAIWQLLLVLLDFPKAFDVWLLVNDFRRATFSENDNLALNKLLIFNKLLTTTVNWLIKSKIVDFETPLNFTKFTITLLLFLLFCVHSELIC